MTIVWILIEVTATLIIALGLTRVTRKSRAAVRHVLLSATFGVLLILPVASIIAPSISVEVPVPMAVQAAIGPLDAGGSSLVKAVQPRVSAKTSTAVVTSDEARRSWPPVFTWLLGSWMVGTMVFLLPVAFGLWQLRWLRRSGLPWRRGGATTAALATDAGIHRRIDVLLHASVRSPMTFGLVRPAILLPMDAHTWPDDDLLRAVVHELEHVRRVDWLSHCLARAIAACYWFQPMVWIAWRRLVLEAERACDDAVLRHSDPTAYADQLIMLAQRLSEPSSRPQLAMAARRDLITRVRAVLDNQQLRGRAGVRTVLIGCAVAALLVLVLSPLRVVRAQNATITFDVVSIKPCAEQTPATNARTVPGAAAQVSPGYVHWDCASLVDLVNQAYGGQDAPLLNAPRWYPVDIADIGPARVRGGPSWASSDKFTIEVKLADAGAKSGLAGRDLNMNIRATMGAALRAMLEERFQLKLRRETEQRPMYALVIDKAGLNRDKVKPAVDGDCRTPTPRDANTTLSADAARLPVCGRTHGTGLDGNVRAAFTNQTFDTLAVMLSGVLDRHVLDRTGDTRKFHFAIDYTPDDDTPGRRVEAAQAYVQLSPRGPVPVEPATRGTAPTIFKAVELLGFRLESTNGLAEFLLIESAQRPRPNSPEADALPARVQGPGRTNR